MDYLRVTQVLSPFSGLSRIPKNILEKAAERGTKVHELCDSLIAELGEFGTDEETSGFIESFKSWKGDKKFLPKPDRFYCDAIGITGECDALYLEDDKIVLVDFKTSVKESKTWVLQGSAYAHLARKSGLDIHRIEFIKLCKNGGPAKVFIYEENFDFFLKCLEIYKHFFAKDEEDFLQLI